MSSADGVAARLEDDETGSDLGRVLALSDGVFANDEATSRASC